MQEQWAQRHVPWRCQTMPGRLMCGVQFFEAHIGCQLLLTSRFVDLLGGVP